MIKICHIPLLILPFIAFSQQSNNKYTVKKSSLNFIASSNITLSNHNLTVLQSSGQSSIVGNRNLKSLIVQQGYLNSTFYLKVHNSDSNFVSEQLNFVISPNPFIDHVKINFDKKTKHDVIIRVYDVNGKTFINKRFKPTDIINLPLRGFSVGTYLIKIDSGINSSTKKILKNN